jgi:enoyl-CoA hydratase
VEFTNLLFEQRGAIALVTMNRPQVLNALSSETLVELGQALDEIEANAGIKGAVITGSGKAFVAGADISQMAGFNPTQAREYMKLGQTVFSRMESIPKPFIAAVNGYALGGGCELAMACDIRVASDRAVFGQPETKLGIFPGFGGTQRLPRLTGAGIARELIYTARNVSAAEALSIGLVNKVVPPEQLLDEALAMMEGIVSKSGIVIGFAKTAINRGQDLDLEKALEIERDLISLLFSTEDQKEGMQAFLEKRTPAFKS